MQTNFYSVVLELESVRVVMRMQTSYFLSNCHW